MKHPAKQAGRSGLDLVLFCGLTLLLSCSVGTVMARTPSTAELLETASSPGSQRSQVRAMHALSLRGYFEARPMGELRDFLATAPQPVVDYVHRVQRQLLRPRPPNSLP